MLIQPDSSRLGFSNERSADRLREELYNDDDRFRFANQAELANAERSAGPRLQYTEVISRLRRAIPALKILDGSPGNVALYCPRNRRELAELDAQGGRNPNQDLFFYHHKYVGGFPKQDMPEYSRLIVDDRNIPLRDYRGWRTVLLGLIEQGVMSYRDSVKHFGTATGQRSSLWYQQVRQYMG